MKTVFNDTAKVAHVWAHQTQETARYRDNFRCEGKRLYSYSTIVGLRVRRPDRDANHIGEPIAFLTGETYSVTTSRHMGDAWAAVRGMERHAVPDLDSLVCDGLEFLASEWEAGRSGTLARRIKAAERGDGRGFSHYSATRARKAVAEWLAANVAAIRANAPGEANSYREQGGMSALAAILAEMAGYTEKQRDSMLEKAERDAAERKRKADKREHDSRIAEGRRLADMSDSEFAELWPADGTRTGADDYQAKRGAEFARNLARLHKASKAAGYTDRTRELWRKVKLYREHLAGRDARIVAAYRAELAAAVVAWRRGEGERPDAYRFQRFPAIKAALERAQAREFAERHAEAYRAWQAGEGARPSESSYEAGSPEAAAIAESKRADRLAFLARFAMWERGEGERPADLASDAIPSYSSAADSDYRRISDARAKVKADVEREKREAAEREAREREAKRYAEAADIRRAWLAGESDRTRDPVSGYHISDETGGALIRANGERLETSHGAEVPLEHAIKAFRFVKLVRERGETWRRNGRTIRVGHYQIDCIDSGGFNAGCHRINWPEIERLARELGVYEAPADNAAEVTSH